jgi:hypothetical protein
MMHEDDSEGIEFNPETLNTTTFGQLLQLQIRMNLLEDKLNVLERSLNLIKIGGTFILLIVSCDYLADMGWFGSKLQIASKE